MMDWAHIHHHGIVVADLDQAIADYEAALGLTFAKPRAFDPLDFWTPEDGLRQLKVRATYSLDGPVRLELVQGEGSFYDPARPEGARHMGIFVEDLAAEADRLVAAGWTVRGANAAPQDGYGIIAYLASPDRAILVELIGTALKPVLDSWLAEG